MEGTMVADAGGMLDAVSNDAFSSADVATEAPETTEIEASPDAPEESVADVTEEPAEPEQEPADEEPAEEQAAAPETEELPDGVKAIERDGKKSYSLNETRYRNFHDAYKTVREFENIIGEPLTPEAFDVRHRAYLGQERLFGDLLSGEPQSQASVIQHFFDESKRAQQEGEVGGDPMVPFAQEFYKAAQANPAVSEAIRTAAATDIIQSLYQLAAQTGNKNLYLSLGHIADAFKMPYKTEAEMQQFFSARGAQNDPLTDAQKRIKELEGQINGNQTQARAQQLDAFVTRTKQAVQTSLLSDAVRPVLADSQKAWEKFPDAFEDLVVNRLNSAVRETISKDANFNSRIQLLDQAAKRAASEEKRNQFGEQIRDAYVTRGKLAAEALKGRILDEAAKLFKARSDERHQRLGAAQNQRGPKGSGAAVPKSLVNGSVAKPANANGFFDPAAAARQISELLR